MMTEERPIGGTCVNRGCLPSKNLIEVARIVHEARNPRYPGLAPAESRLLSRRSSRKKADLVHDYRRKEYESLIADRIRIASGHVEFVDSHSVDVDGKTFARRESPDRDGARPALPELHGLDRIRYMTSDLLTVDEPMELREVPKSLLVIGGGYIALELGQMFSRFGSDAIILERNEQLLAHGYEREVGRSMAEMFAQEGTQMLFNATSASTRQVGAGVVTAVNVAGRERQIRSERLMVATGERPNTGTHAAAFLRIICGTYRSAI